MSKYFYFENYGLSVAEKDRPLAKQYMLACDLNMDNVRCHECGSLCWTFQEKMDLIGDSGSALVDFETFYLIAKNLFGKVTAYYENDESNDDYGWRERAQREISSEDDVVKTISCSYSEEDGTVFSDKTPILDVVKIASVREDLDDEAEMADIESSWIGEGEDAVPDPENEEFCEFCEESFKSYIDFEGIAATPFDDELEQDEPDWKSIDLVLKNAEELGFDELAKRLKEML